MGASWAATECATSTHPGWKNGRDTPAARPFGGAPTTEAAACVSAPCQLGSAADKRYQASQMKRAALALALSLALAACTTPRETAAPVVTPPNLVPTPSEKPQLLVMQCRNLPEYPRAARDRRATGTAVISITVASDGSVVRAEIKQSSGHADLDQATLGALSRCPARAAYKDGQPVEATMDIALTWRLGY